MPKAEIAATGGYDLSLNRYKEVVHEAVEHARPAEIIAELRALEEEIAEGLDAAGGDAGVNMLPQDISMVALGRDCRLEMPKTVKTMSGVPHCQASENSNRNDRSSEARLRRLSEGDARVSKFARHGDHSVLLVGITWLLRAMDDPGSDVQSS